MSVILVICVFSHRLYHIRISRKASDNFDYYK